MTGGGLAWIRFLGFVRFGLPILVALAMTGLIGASATDAAGPLPNNWVAAGHDARNSRTQFVERTISASNASSLVTKWAFTTAGDVSATPTSDNGFLYFPDWGGYLYKVDATSGALIWKHLISDYDGLVGAVSRSSPAINGNTLFIGDLPTVTSANFLSARAHVMAIDATTGNLIWITTVDPHPLAIVSQSPVTDGNRVYVGLSSQEEGAQATNPNYRCCTFRGSVVALDVGTGNLLWKTYVVPIGYSGGAIWGSAPTLDFKQNSLYTGTGNNYTVPSYVQTCLDMKPSSFTCTSPTDYVDSLLALDLTTGAVKWHDRTVASDLHYDTCTTCRGLDDDFGSGPNLFTTTINGQSTDIVGVGQKSGIYWAINPDNGQYVWATKVGPGSMGGGIMWGTSWDGARIYVGDANALQTPYQLQPSGQVVTGGFWTALDPATGRILWQTADPSGGLDTGPVSVANGVVFAGSMSINGPMYAINAATGLILWTFTSGGSVNGSPAIVNGRVYWGSGYARSGSSNNQLFAFGLP